MSIIGRKVKFVENVRFKDSNGKRITLEGIILDKFDRSGFYVVKLSDETVKMLEDINAKDRNGKILTIYANQLMDIEDKGEKETGTDFSYLDH